MVWDEGYEKERPAKTEKLVSGYMEPSWLHFGIFLILFLLSIYIILQFPYIIAYFREK